MCDLWHPVWLTVADSARAKPAIVAAIRLALESDARIIAAPLEVKARAIGLGFRLKPELVGRVFEAMSASGVLVGGQLVTQLPEPTTEQVAELRYSQHPEAVRRRRRRHAQAAASRGELSTGDMSGQRPTVSQDVPLNAGQRPHDVPLAVGRWARMDEELKGLNLPSAPGLPPPRVPPGGANVPDNVPSLRIRNQDTYKKEPALRREPLSGAVVKPEEAELDHQAWIKIRWVRKVMRFAEREVRAERFSREAYDRLCDALTTKLLTAYARRECNLPLEIYKTIQELDLRMKGRAAVPAQLAPDPQASLLLPIEEPVKIGLGAPGTDTLAPIEGELPEALSA